MNNYNIWQRGLHRLALSYDFMRETSFDLEKMLFLKRAKTVNAKKPVFVTGLARGGTTILLEAIHASGDFASLSYSNMPFLLAPNLWGMIARNSSNKDKSERAHGDGIMISTNSPEAFEEVFWKTFSRKDGVSQFKDYMQLILHSYQKNRYLSKNNQNVNRIDTIRALLPNAKILIVFKSPLSHAYDLLTQHRSFAKVQQKDGFIKDYMDWIGHSEFGLSYQPIVKNNLVYTDFNHIDHWLEQWLMLYSKLLGENSNFENTVFIDGGSLRPNGSWDKIKKFIAVQNDFLGFRDIREDLHIDCDQKLLSKCQKLYSNLQNFVI